MKLTVEQIECINQNLISKGVQYDDVNLEVLDHIASEIEVEMDASNNDFQIVYNQIFEKWKHEFDLSKGFLSIRSTTPKIVHSKLRNQMKMEVVVAIVSSIVLLTCFQLVADKQDKLQFLKIVKDIMVYTFCTTVAAALLMKFWNSKSKVTSTYKYLFDSRVTLLIFFLSFIINPSIPRDITNQNLFVATIGYFFVLLLSIIFVGMKHVQFQRKNSIL